MNTWQIVLAIVQSVVLAAVAVLAPLLPKYLVSRVENAARGEVDKSVAKAVAEYNHTLELQLEGHKSTLTEELEKVRQELALDRERYARDYGLFAARRNEVYAETFAGFQKALGGYSPHFASGMRWTKDFSQSPEIDLRHVAQILELVSASERADLTRMIDNGSLREAGMLANVLMQRDQLRQANRALVDFRNLWALNALYFSPGVDTLIEEAVKGLRTLNIYADSIIEDSTTASKDGVETLKKVDAMSEKLKREMRAEIQAGFSALGRNGDDISTGVSLKSE